MKKLSIILAGVTVLALGSCSEGQFVSNSEGEGSLMLSTSINTDMRVESRSLSEDLSESTMIWISGSEGLIHRYNSLSEVPSKAIPLLSGNYVVEGWAGDSVSASFETRWFKGREEITINDGQITPVTLNINIANVAVSVVYDEEVDDVLLDYTLTVSHDRGSLTYTGRDDENKRGYFMMPSTDKDLTYTLSGKLYNGTSFSLTGKIADAKGGTEYKLNVKYTPDTTEIGGGMFTIKIDTSEILVESSQSILTAPTIDGYGFDISSTLRSKKGELGSQIIYVRSATTLASVEIVSDELTDIIGGADVELFGMTDAVKTKLADAGITYENNVENGKTIFKLSFDESYMNALADGEYSYSITVADKDGRTASAVLQISISDDPVVLQAVNDEEVYTNRATLRGIITKNDIEDYGFKYRASGESDWTYVEGTTSRAVGDEFFATIKSLKSNTKYEVVACSGTFETSSATFTTEEEAQLPDADFETAYLSGSAYMFGDSNNMFWDSGNTGSTTLGSSYNITTLSSDYKHGGETSVKLASRKVVIKFAAGNIFTGKYLATDGTDGVLGWGRPFTSRPTAMKLWVKYTPVAIDNVDSSNPDGVVKGDMDRGIVYIALVDETTTSYNGQNWPVVIKTKSSSRQLFDKSGSNVIAYGEKVFYEATTSTDECGMLEVTIPLEYKSTAKPSNIIVVGSASKLGDYFTGGAGSTMYIDDIELIYE